MLSGKVSHVEEFPSQVLIFPDPSDNYWPWIKDPGPLECQRTYRTIRDVKNLDPEHKNGKIKLINCLRFISAAVIKYTGKKKLREKGSLSLISPGSIITEKSRQRGLEAAGQIPIQGRGK